MLKKLLSIFVIVCSIIFILTKGCIYTAITCFMLLSSLGFVPIYCVGEVEGEGVNHAWVRVQEHNIEQSRFNLYHSDKLDYNNPHHTFNTTTDFLSYVKP